MNDKTRVEKSIERLENHPWLAGVIVFGIIVVALGSVSGAINDFLDLKSRFGSEVVQNPELDVESGTESSAACANLEISAVRPAYLLEGYRRQYKIIGKGFCSDTLIQINQPAFVGSSTETETPADSAPTEVSKSGDWMTVQIYVTKRPSYQGASIILENPDGETADHFVPYQR